MQRLSFLFVMAALAGCAAARHLQQPSGASSCTETAWSLLESNPDLSTLKAAVEAAGLRATLDDPRLVATIFAPSDSAFERTLRDGGGTEEALLQNKSLLASLISYHVVPGRAFKADQLKQGLRFRTLQGGEFAIDEASIENDDKYAGCAFLDIHIDTYIDEDAEPRQCDLQACQAVMHVVDYLMVPSAPGIRELLPNAELKAAVGR